MQKVTNIGKYSSVKVDLTGLNALLKGMDEHLVVRVGILGNKPHSKERHALGDLKKGGGHNVSHETSELTNADIGLRHEKGVKSERLPRRSWLVDPLTDHIPEYFQKLGHDVIEQMVKSQSIKAYTELGVVCMQIIQKGFDTGGYGKWQGLSRMTIALKGSSKILIDSGQLAKAVSFDVVTK